MKTILSALVVVSGVVLTPLAVRPQEHAGCFMRGSNGQLVDLGYVCADTTVQPQTSASGTFRVPIKRRDAGIPVIDVTFNGKQRFEMLLDTGASATTISPEMAKALGINIDREIPVATAGGVVQAGIGRVASVQAGGMVIKDLDVLVSPHLPIGLLGQNFFGGHDVTIRDSVVELHIR
ncbi:aspartyl protease [Hydrococcus rivularis NIES-593]|uniref:Aspartyl protease n=1 Tax=Hydrococcus rivularis NIES-593 TaxID=1921803 RepID=A0A1U7HAJ6_9CYAN|nr:retropepsin-like aspartic protease [Hydrococcus rivularis]OKH20617.1 aspartyl protease [Hydrococcus rivularis NIES-593]